jgi:hypothetical protein
MNAIVLMAIGDKYSRSLNAVRGMFLRYASSCNADLVVCDVPPDPSFKRNVLCQKMLLPDLYKQYDWIAFLDLDILISRHAPSIFDFTDDRGAFSAVVDQRDSEKFENVVRGFWKQPAILNETHKSYFSDRGFPDHPLRKASVNGGVWLCKPSRISSLFRTFYFSEFGPMVHEEAMMAFVAQRANLFFELDYRFNTQLIFELFSSLQSPVLGEINGWRFRWFKRHCAENIPLRHEYPRAYQALVNSTQENCYFLHFSSGFPYINIESDLTLDVGSPPGIIRSNTNASPTSWKAIRPASRALLKLISERRRRLLGG